MFGAYQAHWFLTNILCLPLNDETVPSLPPFDMQLQQDSNSNSVPGVEFKFLPVSKVRNVE